MTALLLLALLAAEPAERSDEAMPLGMTSVPLQIDLEQYLPPLKPPVPCDPGMTTFEPKPTPLAGDFGISYIDQKTGKKSSWLLEPGMLVSECGFVEMINIRAEHKRLKLELSSLRDLRVREFDLWKQAELGYQTRIVGLENDLRDVSGFWQLYDLDETHTLARFGTRVDVGPALPGFLQDYATRKNVPQTMDHVRRWVDSNGTWRP